MLIHYLVKDEPAAARFQSGLFQQSGRPKLAALAFPFPLAQAGRSGGKLVLWGQVRPRSGAQTSVSRCGPVACGATAAASAGQAPAGSSASPCRAARDGGAGVLAAGRRVQRLARRSVDGSSAPAARFRPCALPRLYGGFAVRLAFLVAGLFLCACGIVCFLESELGLPPWDVLHQGLAEQLGISFGSANLLVSVAVLVLFLGPPGAHRAGHVPERAPDRLVPDRVCPHRPDDRALGPEPRVPDRADRGRAAVLRRRLGVLHLRLDGRRAARLADARRLAARRGSGRRRPDALEIAAFAVGFALGGTAGIGTIVFALGIGPAVEASFWLLGRTALASAEVASAPAA